MDDIRPVIRLTITSFLHIRITDIYDPVSRSPLPPTTEVVGGGWYRNYEFRCTRSRRRSVRSQRFLRTGRHCFHPVVTEFRGSSPRSILYGPVVDRCGERGWESEKDPTSSCSTLLLLRLGENKGETSRRSQPGRTKVFFVEVTVILTELLIVYVDHKTCGLFLSKSRNPPESLHQPFCD